MSENVLLDAVLSYAHRGWYVLPLHHPTDKGCSCGNGSCESIGKHPLSALVPRGFKDATTDIATLTRWWISYPKANIGIACRLSGLLVVDVDPQNGGDRTFGELVASHGPFPATATVDTGGGGFHQYFENPGKKVSSPGKGIDIKDDGYVAAPASLHRSGIRYSWRGDLSQSSIALLPGWMLGPDTAAVADKSVTTVAVHIPEGVRNSTLTSLAGTMRSKGMSETAILAALLADNEARCSPPLPEAEVRLVVKSVSQYPTSPKSNFVATTKLPTISWRDLIELSQAEPPVDLVEGLITKGTIALIYGFGGIGKSLLSLTLAWCIEHGEPFLGLFACRRARVGYIDEESQERLLGARLLDLTLGQGSSLSEKERTPSFAVGAGAALDTPEGTARVSQWISDNQFEVLFVDTLRRVTPGLKENDSDDMARLHRSLMTLRAAHPDLTIILLHHARKGGQGIDPAQMARGSGDLFAAVDSAFYLDKADVPRSFTVENTKARWSSAAERFTVYIEMGTGGICLMHAGVAPVVKSETKSKKAGDVMCAALKDAPNYTLTRRELLDIAKNQAHASQNTAISALRHLTKKGVMTVTAGKGKSTTYQLFEPVAPF